MCKYMSRRCERKSRQAARQRFWQPAQGGRYACGTHIAPRSVRSDAHISGMTPTIPRPPLPAPPRLLNDAAHRSARLLCRHFALAADHAVRQLDGPGADVTEAHHDLRVALRQLRVTLGAYAPVLSDTVPGTIARRAQKLARRIGYMRDRDVQAALMTQVAAARTTAQRAALSRLPLPTAAESENTTHAARLQQRWQRIAKPLFAALEEWHERRTLDGPHVTLTFATLAADALDRAADRVARRGAAIRSADDMEALHSARLALKSARYLLKPLASHADDAPELLQSLRHAQDAFGDINDAHALRDRLRTVVTTLRESGQHTSRASLAGLAASERDLTARIAVAFNAAAAWHEPEPLQERVARLKAIAARWRTRDAEMPVEIERKWLLSALPPRVLDVTPATLQQGYLPGESLVERIRSTSTGEGTHWVRTVKLGRGMARIEVEEDATDDLGAALFALTPGRRVTKLRYAMPEGLLTWEIDHFTDRDLVLAEVELPTEETQVVIPSWLAPYIVRDVTDEREFTNWQLAR